MICKVHVELYISAVMVALDKLFRDSGQDNPLDRSDVVLERPRSRQHGHWALSVAMKVAKGLGLPPRRVAEVLAEALSKLSGIERVEVAGVGFVNLTLTPKALAEVVDNIRRKKFEFGRNMTRMGEEVNLEFVSGNPTGPLHLAHSRWAAVGDSLARVLEACGAGVVREYYINDAGRQMQLFGESIYARAHNLPLPEGGYPGGYVEDLAREITGANPELLKLEKAEACPLFQRFAYRLQLDEIQRVCADFRLYFDVWFSESTLHEPGSDGLSEIDRAIALARERGWVYERDGALWLKTSEFGDDKDRVLVRANSETTYFASDLAYFLNKTARGFRRKLVLVGADHHGYVLRLRAAARLAGGEEAAKRFEILVGQMVSVRGARLSKRAGNLVLLSELVSWLGVDALRFWLCRYPVDTPLDLRGEDLRKQSPENPVFYVQYAYARTRAVGRRAADLGVGGSDFSPESLVHPNEVELLVVLNEYPRVVETAGRMLEPHRVARYLEELAGCYHRWYDSCRIIPGSVSVDSFGPEVFSRLALNNVAGQVLANGLDLIGVVAPEKM